METVSTLEALRETISKQKQLGKQIVFVPTMGNLHQGHLELVKLARQKADYVVTSIFVNPMQFGPGEDFDKYPRTHEEDSRKLTEQGCDLLFLPDAGVLWEQTSASPRCVQDDVLLAQAYCPLPKIPKCR